VTGSCLVALNQRDEAVWKSGRNMPGVDVRPFADVNAYHVLRPRRLVFSREAFGLLKNMPRIEKSERGAGPAGK
jgi:large subunit ribosomal protein L4